jgi:hypothetical protein
MKELLDQLRSKKEKALISNIQGVSGGIENILKEPLPIIVEARFAESTRQLQTAVSPHPLKIGHTFI